VKAVVKAVVMTSAKIVVTTQQMMEAVILPLSFSSSLVATEEHLYLQYPPTNNLGAAAD